VFFGLLQVTLFLLSSMFSTFAIVVKFLLLIVFGNIMTQLDVVCVFMPSTNISLALFNLQILFLFVVLIFVYHHCDQFDVTLLSSS